jgi:glycosyltransferase involved in cell wall biosynthesis
VLRVVFLANGSKRVPSARTRAYQLIPALRRADLDASVVDPDALPNRLGFTRLYRLAALRAARAADVVVVQKQLFGRAMLRALTLANPQLVYDFDDALYAPRSDDRGTSSRPAARELLDQMLARARLVIAGNDELARYAMARARRVAVVPTVVDTEVYCRPTPRARSSGTVVIGWTGTAANLRYLEPLRETIQDIQREDRVPTEFRVISSQAPDWPDVDGSFRRWTLEGAIDEIADLDIGLMPLPDTPWTRGKCGFKALEYMALGLPAIASPVGVMPKILGHGRTGFLAGDPAEWRTYLDRLIADPELRQRLGDAGRREVAERYSVQATAPRLARLLESVASPVRAHTSRRDEDEAT